MIHVFHQAYMTHTSTSPDYQILASLDLGRSQAALAGFELVQKQIENAMRLRDAVDHHPLMSRYMRCLTTADLIPAPYRSSGIDQPLRSGRPNMIKAWDNDEFVLDPSRITIYTGATGIDGDAFKRSQLMDRYGVQINKTSRNTVLFMTTIGTIRSSVAYLIEVLVAIARELDARVADMSPPRPDLASLPCEPGGRGSGGPRDRPGFLGREAGRRRRGPRGGVRRASQGQGWNRWGWHRLRGRDLALYLLLGHGGQRQRAHVAQQRHPGQDGHRQRRSRLAVAHEDLSGAERAPDGGQAGRRQHGEQPVPYGHGPGHQQDRGADQGEAEQRVDGQRQRGGGDLAEDPGLRIGGRDGDVEVQEDAQAVLDHQHHQRRQAYPAQSGPPRPAHVPARGHEFVKAASHRTRSPFSLLGPCPCAPIN